MIQPHHTITASVQSTELIREGALEYGNDSCATVTRMRQWMTVD